MKLNLNKRKKNIPTDISNKNQEMSFKLTPEGQKDFDKKLEIFLNTDKNP